VADVAKDFSVVDYYRCDPCGFVWSHRKHDPNAPAVPVTPAATSRFNGAVETVNPERRQN
jgi:hypothetical protein